MLVDMTTSEPTLAKEIYEAAKAKGVAFEKAVFPWAASGRSLANGRDEGFTKLLFDPQTHRVIGGGARHFQRSPTRRSSSGLNFLGSMRPSRPASQSVSGCSWVAFSPM